MSKNCIWPEIAPTDEEIEVGQEVLEMEFSEEFRSQENDGSIEQGATLREIGEDVSHVYSHELIMSLREGNQSIENAKFLYYDYRAHLNCKATVNDGIYSRNGMLAARTMMNYHWNEDVKKPERDGLLIVNHHFPTEKRSRRKVKSEEYWIWHNTNAQQSFAAYFGFFPFYLPHFDAVAFLSVARPESIIPAYLMSGLFQEHLALREYYEGERWQKIVDDRLKESLEMVHKITAKFPLTDQHSIVHYQDSAGKVQTCSLHDAMIWYERGFFTSEMKFAVAPPGENMMEKKWMVLTLKELVQRNGRAMPFLFSTACLRESMDRMEELSKLRNDLSEAKIQRDEIKFSIIDIHKRLAAIQTEMHQLSNKNPYTSIRYAQTREKMANMDNIPPRTEAPSPSVPSQITVPPGVDPFALLRMLPSDYKGSRVIGNGSVAEKLSDLHANLTQCDKKLLAQRTWLLFNKNHTRLCQVCGMIMQSAPNMIQHICSKQHYLTLDMICQCALQFWLDAVASCTDLQPAADAETAVLSRVASATKVVLVGVAVEAAPDSPLGVLCFHRQVTYPCGNLQRMAVILNAMLRDCDKKALDADPALRALFKKKVTCSVCTTRDVTIDKPANLVAHIATTNHVNAATKGGQVSINALNYWMAAIHRATPTRSR